NWYMVWSPGDRWPNDRIEKQFTTVDKLVISGTRMTYQNPARPQQLDTVESLLCADSMSCDELSGKWVTTRTVTSYYPSGLVRTELNASGVETLTVYDPRGLPINITRSAAGVSFQTSFTYDDFGGIETYEDINHEKSKFQRDAFGRIIREELP